MFEVLILAVVQGLTEFLPVSSSGHLVILGELLGLEVSGIELNIALHVGTLLSILIFYRQRLVRLLLEEPTVIGRILVASLPAALFGFTLKATSSGVLENARQAALMLLVTGVVLVSSRWIRPGDTRLAQLTLGRAFVIGICQAFALLPGISRSGITIVGAQALGLGRASSVTFSFLLAIPAIVGAAGLELGSLLRSGDSLQIDAVALMAGLATACLVGLIGLRWLLAWVQKGGLPWFALWCIPMGTVALLLL